MALGCLWTNKSKTPARLVAAVWGLACSLVSCPGAGGAPPAQESLSLGNSGCRGAFLANPWAFTESPVFFLGACPCPTLRLGPRSRELPTLCSGLCGRREPASCRQPATSPPRLLPVKHVHTCHPLLLSVPFSLSMKVFCFDREKREMHIFTPHVTGCCSLHLTIKSVFCLQSYHIVCFVKGNKRMT